MCASACAHIMCVHAPICVWGGGTLVLGCAPMHVIKLLILYSAKYPTNGPITFSGFKSFSIFSTCLLLIFKFGTLFHIFVLHIWKILQWSMKHGHSYHEAVLCPKRADTCRTHVSCVFSMLSRVRAI